MRSRAVPTRRDASGAVRHGEGYALVPVPGPTGTIARRFAPLARPRVEAHRTPLPASARDRTANDRPVRRPPTAARRACLLPGRSAALRRDDRPRVPPDLGRPARGAPDRARLGCEQLQLGLRIDARQPDQPGARGRGSQVPQGRRQADRDRPLAQQGHDRPGLLQPHDPRHELQRVPHPRHKGLLLPPRRREHRLEQLPGRRRHEHGRAPVHGVPGPPGEHPRQVVGRGRDRRLQGPDRQEDVDRDLRRPLRHVPGSDPEADPEADSEADRQAEARGDTEADAEADR